jgi:colanic acid/amylovoran biosynthesis glycosyltransferase
MSEPLTIGYLTSVYARAGDTFIRQEVEQLRRLGHVVHTFSIRRPDPSELVSETIRQEHGRTVYLLEAGLAKLALAGLRQAISAPGKFLDAARLVIRTVPPGIEKRWARRVAYLFEAAYLAELLAGTEIRHLHNHIGENSALVAMLAAMFRGIPYSLTIHGPGEFDRPAILALGEKIRRAAFVAAISEFTRSQLYRWCTREDWSKIHVIHCGLGEDFLSAATVTVPDRPRLVSVGRLAEQKGHLLLIEAARRLREQGLDFELVLVGDGPLREEIERLIERFALQGCVQITGFQSSQGVREELQAARALVLPSFAEGLPVAIMEAMALGRPIISTHIAGIPELVEPGRTGWLVPAGALEPLVDAMAEALTADPVELERMGRAGAARAAEQHEIGTEVRKLAALFANPGADANPPDQLTTRSAAVALR